MEMMTIIIIYLFLRGAGGDNKRGSPARALMSRDKHKSDEKRLGRVKLSFTH